MAIREHRADAQTDSIGDRQVRQKASQQLMTVKRAVLSSLSPEEQAMFFSEVQMLQVTCAPAPVLQRCRDGAPVAGGLFTDPDRCRG